MLFGGFPPSDADDDDEEEEKVGRCYLEEGKENDFTYLFIHAQWNLVSRVPFSSLVKTLKDIDVVDK